MPGLPDVGGLLFKAERKRIHFLLERGEKGKDQNMPKNRVKQRSHLKCGMAKEERLRREANGGLGDGLDRKNCFGLSDPTPYKAVKNMIRKGERL